MPLKGKRGVPVPLKGKRGVPVPLKGKGEYLCL